MAVQKSAVNVVLVCKVTHCFFFTLPLTFNILLQGTANFCQSITSGIRTQEGVNEILDIFQEHGHSEVSVELLLAPLK